VSAPLPPELGGTNPFAHVLMMGGVAIVALVLLRHIRAEMSGRPAGPGLVRQATGVAVGMGMTAALGAAGSAAVAGAGKLGRRLGRLGQMTPWEKLEAQSKTAAAVHGAPQPGFDPVPAGGDSGVSARGGGAGTDGGVAAAGKGVGSARSVDLGEAAAVAAVSYGGGSGVESSRRRGRPPAQPRATQPDSTSVPSTRTEIDVPAVPPMVETDGLEPIPPPEPPHDDEPPPDDDADPPGFSFDTA
jgi:hypothetical protein